EEREGAARGPAEEAGDDEGPPLVRVHVDPDRLRAARVVARGAQREPERRAADRGQRGETGAARGEGEVVVADRRREPGRGPDAEEAVVTARHVVPLVHDRGGELGEG